MKNYGGGHQGGRIHLSEFLVEDRLMPHIKMARRDLGWIPTGDVLRGGNGKFITLIQKHPIPPV